MSSIFGIGAQLFAAQAKAVTAKATAAGQAASTGSPRPFITGPQGELCATGKKESDIKRMYGYTDRDNIRVLTVSKQQAGKYAGAHVYKFMSGKAQRLQQDVYILKGKIASAQYEDMPSGERANKLRYLRCQLKYASSKLSAEVANTPHTGLIVHTEDDEE